MFLTKKTYSAPAPVVTTVQLTAFAPSLESYLAELPTRFPGVAVQHGVALESQQLDNSAQQAAIDQVMDTLDKYDEDHPHTGSMHVYLLDGKGLSAGDPQGEGTLHALVSAALNTPHQTVAALVPEDQSVTKVDDLAPSTLLRQLADNVLSTEGVTVLVGRDALEAFLANPSKASEPAPATEAILATAFGAAVVGLGVVAMVRGFREVMKEQKAFNERKSFIKRIRDKYGNPTWVNKQTLRVGNISADGIAKPLNLAAALADPSSKATLTATSAVAWATKFSHAGSTYLTALTSKSKSDVHSDSGIVALANWVKTVKRPIVEAPFTIAGLLQDLSFEVTGMGGTVRFDKPKTPVADLPALTASSIVATAHCVERLLEAAEEIRGMAEDLSEASFDLPAPNTGADDEYLSPAAQKAVNVVDEAYYSKIFRKEHCWPMQELSDRLVDAAAALGQWIDRSFQK